jgi:hypothetical protein
VKDRVRWSKSTEAGRTALIELDSTKGVAAAITQVRMATPRARRCVMSFLTHPFGDFEYGLGRASLLAAQGPLSLLGGPRLTVQKKTGEHPTWLARQPDKSPISMDWAAVPASSRQQNTNELGTLQLGGRAVRL